MALPVKNERLLIPSVNRSVITLIDEERMQTFYQAIIVKRMARKQSRMESVLDDYKPIAA